VPEYLARDMPEKAGSTIVGGKELLYFDGPLGVYIAGYVKGADAKASKAKVEPVGEAERHMVKLAADAFFTRESVIGFDNSAIIHFSNPGYNLY